MTEKEFKIQVLPLSSLVYPMAKRMLRSEEAAKDAVQLSMLKLWENRKKLKECNSVKAFTYRVVRNTCLDEIKRKKPVLVENSEKTIHFFPTQNDAYDRKEAVELVMKFMEELPSGQREILQMRDIDGLEFTEISELISMDIAYIRVLLSRARKNIKQKLITIYSYGAVRQK